MVQCRPWYRSLQVLLPAAILLPPLGLTLLWLRPSTTLIGKLLGSFLIALFTLAHFYFFFGLRFELDGTGRHPIFSFYKPETHYAALEQSRAEQQLNPPGVFLKTNRSELELDRGNDETARTVFPLENGTSGSADGSWSPYWTNFRGPGWKGCYDQMKIRTHWPSEGLPLLWRQPIGGGYASFVIAQGRVFTIEQRRRQEVVTAYELEQGRELWAHGWIAEFREALGGNGPRATPIWDKGRLYALGATGQLVCLEAETGRLLWSLNILADNQAENLPWGMANSPLIVDHKVIVLPGGSSGNSVAAYHKLTGQPIWKSLSDQQAYTSPMLVSLAGQRQILVVSAERAMGLTLADGSLLWDYPWVTSHGVNSAQPIAIGENRFFISAGYGHGSALVEVSHIDGRYTTRTVWKNINMKNKFNSSVLYKGHIYGLDEGILACINVETGRRCWKAGRYGYGQLLLADGHLIVLTEGGELVLLKATPERHLELERFSAVRGKTWNYPAMADGRLLVRNATQMACFDVRPRGRKPQDTSSPW